jgi:hypothetical protein
VDARGSRAERSRRRFGTLEPDLLAHAPQEDDFVPEP